MTLKTPQELLNRIKKKNFVVTYEEAIDLYNLFDDLGGVEYVWKQTVDGKQVLTYVSLGCLSGLNLKIA